MDLHRTLEQVTDQESFFTFVQALINDRKEALQEAERQHILNSDGQISAEPGGWQNGTIEQFLDGALSWAQSTDMGQRQGLPGEPSWKAFAVFLYCGKIYE